MVVSHTSLIYIAVIITDISEYTYMYKFVVQVVVYQANEANTDAVQQ